MSNLDPLADEAVRSAVEAFVAGAFVPDFRGETIFETENSRYRLLDGVVIAAPDESLLGAELVGWLLESQEGGVVETAWRTGARAVLVDRRQARNIVVTSSTRLRSEGERTPAPRGPRPRPAQRPAQPSYIAMPVQPPPVAPATAMRLAPILAATPPPLPVATVVPVPPASSSEPSQPRAVVHPPPRPISRPSAPQILPPPPPRPLPPPMAPPRRPPPPPADEMASSSALPLVTRIPAPAAAPGSASEPPGWEVTSSEFEIAEDLEAGAPASRKAEQHDTLEDIPVEAPDSANGTPFLLTRQAPSVPPPPYPER